MNLYTELEKSFGFFSNTICEGRLTLQKYFREKLEDGFIDREQLINEFKLAQQDFSFDWKNLAKRKSFVSYRDGMTAKHVMFSFEVLTREFLNPKMVMTRAEFVQLENLLFSNLNREGWTSFVDLIKEHELLFSSKLLDYYNLARYYRIYGYRFFEVKRDNDIGNYKIRKRKYDIYSEKATRKERVITRVSKKEPRLTNLCL